MRGLRRRRLLAAGFVSAGAGGGRAAHRAPSPPWTCGRLPAAGPPGLRRCAPRGWRAPGQRHGAQPRDPARSRPAPGGRGPDRADPLGGARSGRRSRGSWPCGALLRRRSGAQSPGPPASGAAADASPGGARGRDATTRVRPTRHSGTGRATLRPAQLRPAPLAAPERFPAGSTQNNGSVARRPRGVASLRSRKRAAQGEDGAQVVWTLSRGPTLARTGLQPEGQLLSRRGRGRRASAPWAGRGAGLGIPTFLLGLSH